MLGQNKHNDTIIVCTFLRCHRDFVRSNELLMVSFDVVFRILQLRMIFLKKIFVTLRSIFRIPGSH